MFAVRNLPKGNIDWFGCHFNSNDKYLQYKVKSTKKAKSSTHVHEDVYSQEWVLEHRWVGVYEWWQSE